MSLCASAEGRLDAPEGYNGYFLVIVAIVFIVLETLFVAARVLARQLAGTSMGSDDVLVPLSFICNCALCGISIAMVEHGGVGRHSLWNCINQPHALSLYGKLQIPFTIVVFWSITFAKVAILSLYLRIFRSRYLHWATYSVIAIQVSSAIANTVVTCNVCRPISFLWMPERYPGGHCIDINSFWVWANFPQIVTDVLILLLPLHTLWNLKLSKREKLGVTLAFSTASIGLITSIVRFVIFISIDSQTDGSWVGTKLGCMSIVESGMYLIAACLPVYRSFLRVVKKGDRVIALFAGSRSTVRKHTDPTNLSGSEKDFTEIRQAELQVPGTFAPNRAKNLDGMMLPPLDMIAVQREFDVTFDDRNV